MHLVLEVVSSALMRRAEGTVTLTLITPLIATTTTPLQSSALMQTPKRCNYALLLSQVELRGRESKGGRGSRRLLIYHLAALALWKMLGRGEEPGNAFPSSLPMMPRPCLALELCADQALCCFAPKLIPLLCAGTESGETLQAQEVRCSSVTSCS